MSARSFPINMGPRRRSALELRGGSSGSVASQLLARYRRASLQDDARKQHDVLAQLAEASTTSCSDDLRDQDENAPRPCSHRSSVSTVVEDEETTASAHLKEDEPRSVTLQDPRYETQDPRSEQADEREDLAMEAEDCLTPLPTVAARCFRGTSQRRVSATPPAVSGAVTLVPRRRKCGTILREHPHQELYLFRDEAEYSDYVDARVTGVHAEMDSVVYYEVDVHLSQMKWQVLRRFSEFRRLRQRLLKHLSRRQRSSEGPRSKCRICANILQTIQDVPFPSRKQPKSWLTVLGGRVGYHQSAIRSGEIIADRKRMLQEFVVVCLLTVRGLRQHSRLMCDSSACEISVALRMIEEFLGLSFTRYMRFLNERGVLVSDDDEKGATGKTVVTDDRRALLTPTYAASRRATVAV